jgi:hypothetical protein
MKTVEVYNVSFFRKNGDLIDCTQIDENNEKFAWELFEEFGHQKEEGDYLEFDFQGTEEIED